MKTIAIDVTHYNKLSGFGVVTRNIVRGLLETDRENRYILISNQPIDFSDLSITPTHIQSDKPFFWYKFFETANILKENKVDVFLSLDQILPFRKVCKYVVVQHDIGMQRAGRLLLLKHFFENPFYIGYYLIDLERFSLRKADTIIAPSEYVKRDIAEYYKLPESKLHVIHWGIDHLRSLNTKSLKKKDYILFPYCNGHWDFIYALANELLERHVTSHIIMLRPAPATPKNTPSLHPGIEIIRTRIPQEENERYYREALASVYISENDGFGIPPLESMFYGTPVIFNQNTCLEEISGGGGIMVTNMTTTAFLTAIIDLTQGKDRTRYDTIVNKGISFVAQYTWKKTIAQTAELLYKMS